MNMYWSRLSAVIVAFALHFPGDSHAQVYKERLPNYDRRTERNEASVADRQAAVDALKGRLPQVRVDFDEITGGAKMISVPDGYLTGAKGQGRAVSTAAAAAFMQDTNQATMAFLQEHRALFGHGPEALSRARVTREVVQSNNGLRTVVWQQEVAGIPVFEATLVSHTTREGELINVSSAFLPDPDQAAERGVPGFAKVISAPALAPSAAIRIAAKATGDSVDESGVVPTAEAEPSADKKQKFNAAGLQGETTAALTWLPMNREELRLCWDVTFTSRGQREMFRVLVDAQSGEVLVRRSLTDYLTPASYRVFTSDSPSPMSPGLSTPSSTQPSTVSRTLVTLDALSTNASPSGWINDGGNETLGNNVDAHLDRNDDDVADLPRPQGSSRVFDFTLDLTQTPTSYGSATVVQLFYLCNWMHDKLYELGFTEAAGNFQSNNFGRGGYGYDAVQADAQDGGGYNNANFSTPSDGSPGRMQMYLFDGPSPYRDGDLDAEIVLHEYTHGLSNRRVGGGVGLSALQSRGMGEGWSDFYGLTLLSESGDDVDGTYAAGAYATYMLSGLTQNYYYGIRRYPYSTDMSKNPLTFKDIDPAQASAHSGISRSTIIGTTANEVHNMGEVWCVTLWEARANLIRKYGWTTGNQLILQLVTDGMALSPANPNFVQARDAILQADQVNTGGANRAALWTAFAKRGLGTSATSPTSSGTTGLYEAYDLPDDLSVTPTSLSVAGPVGGPFTPNPVYYAVTNTGTSSLNWSLVNTCTWFNASPVSGTLAAGAGTKVTVTLNASVTNLALGSYSASVVFSNQTSGIAQTRSFSLNAVGRNMSDSFDPGITMSQWSAFGGVVGSTVMANNYGGSVSGANSLWFGDGGSRYATTIPVDTSAGGTVTFYIRLANGTSSTWETADDLPYEGVVLEISTNGGSTWTTIGNYDTTAYYSWTYVNLAIPASAQSPSTLFRWRQSSHSGSGFDHWALDDVSIDSGPTPPRITVQPLTQAVGVGASVTLTVGAGGTSPLSYQWRKNTTAIPGATTSSYTILNAQTNDSGVYSVGVSNIYGTVVSSNATLSVIYVSAPDTLDPSPNGAVYCTAVQPDRKILVGGSFTTIGGLVRNYIARLNADGSVDTGFNPAANSSVYSIAVQPDGKILLGGTFTTVSNYTRYYIARLNPDGSVDTTFNPGTSSYVYSLAVEPDGQILVGGDFSTISSTTRYYLARLNANGSIDTSFNPNPNGGVLSIALQDDGKVVLGGNFTTVGGYGRTYIARVNSDGTTDTNFNPAANSSVYALAVQPDGKIVVGGYFYTLGQYSRNYIARLNADGTIDTAFNPGASSAVYSFALQADGKIIAGGAFSTMGGQTRYYLARLNSDGTIDTGFNPYVSSYVYSVGIQGDGRILLGGSFTTVGNLTRYYLARLTPTELVTQNIMFDGSTAAWLRSGGPEVTRVTFEGSTNFSTWTPLGSASRVAGGWQVTNVSWPSNASLRARGVASSGYFSSSSGIIESSYGPPMIVNHPATQSGAVSGSSAFYVTASGSEPLSYQWRKGGISIPGATASVYSIPDVQLSDAGVYSVVVSNTFGVAVSSNATFTVAYASVPDSFNPTMNSYVYCTAVQPDGKILIGGGFTTVGGVTRNYLARLNSDGTLDSTFNPNVSSYVYSIAVQPDGKILLGGSFTMIGGYSRYYIGRLNADGTVDTAFNPGAGGSVYCLTLQADGKILVGGGFSTLASNSRYYIGRLNSDGTIDSAFNPGASSYVYSIAVQLDGQIVVGGDFTTLGGYSRSYIGRLTSAGTIDTTFNPGANSSVYSTCIQPDGKILLGGYFSTLAGYYRSYIGRLNSDGTIDTAFNPGANNAIYSISQQADGKIIVAGSFTTLASYSRSYLGQLNVDGSIDLAFSVGANSTVYSVALQPDGKLLVAGSFYTLGGLNRTYLARLTASGAATQSVSYDGSTLTWLRGGTSPEVGRTVFEASTGSGWTTLGGGSRISGGWQLGGLSWPTNSTFRARGFLSSGYFNGSSWFVETIAGPPVITNQPLSQVIRLGSPATLTVGVSGVGPMTFLWRRNGIDLAGETNAVLAFAAVSTNNAGDYDIVIANSYGSVTSSVATLTVYVPTPPVIVQQPIGQTIDVATNVSFNVVATGDMPLYYRWTLDDIELPGATASSLTISNVQSWNQGGYRVVITNSMGSITSSVATLVVTPVKPIITRQPESRGVFAGFNVSFAVSVTGSEPFHYQWKLNGIDISAATNAVLTVSNVQAAQTGTYTVATENSAGDLESDGALLALVPVASWGANDSGQNVLPIALTNAVQVAAGAGHNVALRRDGQVVVWGAPDQTNVPPDLTNVVSVAAGDTHSLALRADGAVVGWGNNSSGQTTIPVGLTEVTAIAAGGSHSLALRANGQVVAWGSSSYGQTTIPASATNIVAIAAGGEHSVALRADGKVVAWGRNTSGQTTVPANLLDVVEIAAGASHTLALKSDGTVTAWGDNAYGQRTVPSGLSNVVAISGGGYHSLAVQVDGTVFAWGAGANPYLSFYPHQQQSVIPPSVTNIVQVSGGAAHSVALAALGTPFITEPPLSRSAFSGRRVVFRGAATGALPLAYQWQFNGQNISGATNQLLVVNPATNSGNYRLVVSNAFGVAMSSDAALTLLNQVPFVEQQPTNSVVYLGGLATLRVVPDGSGPFWYQWRFNGVDLIGQTNATLLLEHVLLSQSGNYSVVIGNSFGTISSTKALVSVIQVVAWGAGTNTTQSSPNYSQSIVPSGLTNVIGLAGGGYHSVAIRSNGTVAAWGAGTVVSSAPHYGQSIVPAGLGNVVATAAGLYHTLALRADGTLAAWGSGTTNNNVLPNYGQSIIPVFATNIIAIAAGDYHSVALRADGRVLVWGYNYYYQTNVPAAATSNVVAIASRGNHVLALKSDGSLVHWGSLTSLPGTVSNVVKIAAGLNHCLALRIDGTMVSWGGSYSLPVGLTNVVDIAAGYDHSVALKSDGSVVTWGALTYGRDAIPAGLTNVIGVACGSYNSLAFLGDGSPFIKWQPLNRSAYIGSSATFDVRAVGAALKYQWQVNGTDIPGATNVSYRVATVDSSDAGNYGVVVSNPFGSVTSTVASLTVLLPIGQSVDAPGLVWSTLGNVAWFGENSITHDGVDAAQSGLVRDGQLSSIQTTVAGPGSVSFWWKVSSEEYFDLLNFYIDGVLQTGISGEIDWESQSFPVGAGYHTLRWTYSKDSSVSVGADAAWLDEVTVVANPPVIVLQPISQTNTQGGAVQFVVAATGAPPLTYQWIKAGTNLPGFSSDILELLNVGRRDSDVYAVVVSNPGGSVVSSNAWLKVYVPQRLTPTEMGNDGFKLISSDVGGGTLTPADMANFEVQVSTNLSTWAPLPGVLSLTNGSLLLHDRQCTNLPMRFYRILEH